MLWRWITGARVERTCGAARSRSRRCCRSTVIASEDARVLHPSRHRLAAMLQGCDRGGRRHSATCAAARPSRSRPPRTCSCGRAAASCARRWSSRSRSGSTWCCRKRRVLEIYLNIAEWGPNGEFGVEAGARRAFGKSARDLDAGGGGAAGGDPAQPDPAQCPAAGPRRCGGSRPLMQARRGLGRRPRRLRPGREWLWPDRRPLPL